MQQAVMLWNSHSCLHYHRLPLQLRRLPACRETPVVFDFVARHLPHMPYYPDQLALLFRCVGPRRGGALLGGWTGQGQVRVAVCRGFVLRQVRPQERAG